jgi:hypothetical protein
MDKVAKGGVATDSYFYRIVVPDLEYFGTFCKREKYAFTFRADEQRDPYASIPPRLFGSHPSVWDYKSLLPCLSISLPLSILGPSSEAKR